MKSAYRSNSSLDRDFKHFFGVEELRDYLLSHGQTNQQKEEQVEELFARLDLDEVGGSSKSCSGWFLGR